MSATTINVLMSVPHGGAAGNMLRTGMFARLLALTGDAHFVIVSPLSRDDSFRREFVHERVTFEDLPPHRPEGIEGRLLALTQAAYLESGVTESVRIRRQEVEARGSIRHVALKHRLARVFAPAMVNPRTRYAWSDRLVKHAAANALFDRYQPAMLVTSNPGLIFAEVPLLRTAVQRHVRSVAVDPSWDNFTNKLIPVRRVDRLLVWNELMKAQAIALHGYSADEITVVGTPQWDLYFREGTTCTRDLFFQRIGADPSRKLITLTTTPYELYPHHRHTIKVLQQAMDTGAFGEPVQLLVRVHPRDDLSQYNEFRGVPHIIIEKPFRQTVQAGDGMAADVTSESQRHLADTMRHSDVVMNVASTIAIEAAIFDTPVVNFSFDGEAPEDFSRSARRYYRFTHYQNITRHDAVRVAQTPDELIALVAAYLRNPALDAEGRRRVVAEQCQFVDGHAAARVATAVAEELAHVTGRSLSSEQQPCVASLASSR
jgi:hypothetical protein